MDPVTLFKVYYLSEISLVSSSFAAWFYMGTIETSCLQPITKGHEKWVRIHLAKSFPTHVTHNTQRTNNLVILKFTYFKVIVLKLYFHTIPSISCKGKYFTTLIRL